MDEDNSSITATPKLGIRVSDAAPSPVPPVEPSISSVRPDTGSLSAVAPISPSEVFEGLPATEDSLKLTWPPTKEDLQRLYVEQRLSAAKIAKVYSHETRNPRSGAELIRHYLKKYGIERRDRVAELARTTASDVSEWALKHPPPVSGSGARTNSVPERQPDSADAYSAGLNGEEKAVIELLAIPQLSIKHMDEITRGRIRAVMGNLQRVRGMSLNDIARLIENRTSADVSRWFEELGIEAPPFDEARRRGIIMHRKYPRKPFDGTDEDKAYLLGIAHGDFHVSRPFGDAVRISTSTTHPAMVELFENLFSGHGRVYRYPRYKQDIGTYAWNIQVILHKTFEFLLETREKCREWVATRVGTMLAYLAGLIDAEGNIRLYGNPITIGVIVSIWNTDTDLLEFAHECLAQLGYRPLEPYLSNPPGENPRGFTSKKQGRVESTGCEIRRSAILASNAPTAAHGESCEKEIVLSVARGDLYDTIADKVSSLRKAIKEEVKNYTNQAELEYLRTHPGKNWVILQDVKEATNRDDAPADASMQDSSRPSDGGAGIEGGEDSN